MRSVTPNDIWRIMRRLPSLLRFLNAMPYRDPQAVQRWQLQRIQQLVAHATQRVPFYRRLYGNAGVKAQDIRTLDDIQRLPLVHKDDVIAHYPRDMIAESYDLDRLFVSRSSGSSGKVLDIAYDSDAMTVFIMAGLRLYRMNFAYRPWHTQAYVYTSPYPLRSLLGMYPLRFFSTLTPIPQLLDELRALQPDLLVCYPSHLQQVLASIESHDAIGFRPKAVSVNSEMSTQAQRDEMAARLGCPVLDEYSTEELTRVAAQCTEKTYHVFEDINYIETIDPDDQPTAGVGRIVGTNLHNFAMPMIRYCQSDLGRVTEAHCPCGRRFRTLVDFQGRQNDRFILPSGKVLTSGFLLDATYEFLLSDRGAVSDFCLIQHTPDRVVLEVVQGKTWNESIAGRLRERFVTFLEPGVTFTINPVKECTKTKTGKRNPIISLVSRKDDGTP